MFDSIANPKNLHLATEWSAVLFHLISSGILSTESRYWNLGLTVIAIKVLGVLRYKTIANFLSLNIGTVIINRENVNI